MSKIAVLLATYNGELYLNQLLASLQAQSFQSFDIFVRDDCSNDTTLQILKSYDIKLIPTSKNIGAKSSFMTLLEDVLKEGRYEYFMFCDQDDVWLEDKIEKTIQKMLEVEKKHKKPVLIHTDLSVVDENLTILNNSFWDYQYLSPLSISTAQILMQNNITGCTVMINHKLAKLAIPMPDKAIMHDWWLGLVASQFGKIEYISQSTILYRQHSDNDTGAKRFDIVFVYKKLRMIFRARKEYFLDKNILQAKQFLVYYDDILDADSRQMFQALSLIKQSRKYDRLKILWKYKFFKQGFLRNIALVFMV